jgi:hypothetical protein
LVAVIETIYAWVMKLLSKNDIKHPFYFKKCYLSII